MRSFQAVYEDVKIKAEQAEALAREAISRHAAADYASALKLFREEEQILRELKVKPALAQCLENQASVLSLMGEWEEALALSKEQECLCRESSYFVGLQRSLGIQGNILHAQGNLTGALEMHLRQESICREFGDHEGLYACLMDQATAQHDNGDDRRAMEILKELERLCREWKNTEKLTACLRKQGVILTARKDWDGAEAVTLALERLSSGERGDSDDGAEPRLSDPDSHRDVAEVKRRLADYSGGKLSDEVAAIFSESRECAVAALPLLDALRQMIRRQVTAGYCNEKREAWFFEEIVCHHIAPALKSAPAPLKESYLETLRSAFHYVEEIWRREKGEDATHPGCAPQESGWEFSAFLVFVDIIRLLPANIVVTREFLNADNTNFPWKALQVLWGMLAGVLPLDADWRSLGPRLCERINERVQEVYGTLMAKVEDRVMTE